MIVRFEDVITRITGNVDRYNTDLEYYVGGDQYDSSSLTIERRGDLKKDVDILGFKFHFPFKSGDVLLMARNPHLRKAGQVFFDGLCSDASYILRTKDEKRLRQNYIPIILQSNHFWDWVESHKTGGITFLLNWGMLKGYEFDLPDSDVQDSIMEKVWAAYKLKQSYQKLMIATDEMVKSRFIEECYSRYPKQKLGGHISVIRGVSYKPSDVRSSVDEGVAIILRSNNIADGEINFDDLVYVVQERVQNEQKLKPGDIVMCGSNGSIGLVGKAGLLKDNMPNTAFGAFCLGIKCKETILPEYLNTYFNTQVYRNEIESMGNGTNIINIRPDNITNLSIPIPPVEKQMAFVEVVNQADKSKYLN